MRNLKPGEVGVAYYPMGRREICSEDEFELLDRTFRPGSVCKRFQDDTMSGIVLSTNVSIRVQHAITHELLDRWVPLNETNPGHELEIGDHIIYDDWIGQVCLKFSHIFFVHYIILWQVIEVRPFLPSRHCGLIFTSKLGSFLTKPSFKQAMANFGGFQILAHIWRLDTEARFVLMLILVNCKHSTFCVRPGRARTSCWWKP